MSPYLLVQELQALKSRVSGCDRRSLEQAAFALSVDAAGRVIGREFAGRPNRRGGRNGCSRYFAAVHNSSVRPHLAGRWTRGYSKYWRSGSHPAWNLGGRSRLPPRPRHHRPQPANGPFKTGSVIAHAVLPLHGRCKHVRDRKVSPALRQRTALRSGHLGAFTGVAIATTGTG